MVCKGETLLLITNINIFIEYLTSFLNTLVFVPEKLFKISLIFSGRAYKRQTL
jgi:hypothetical protein